MSTLSEHLDVNILLKSYNNIMIAAATMDIYNYENSKRPTSRFSDEIAPKTNKYWKGHEEKDI